MDITMARPLLGEDEIDSVISVLRSGTLAHGKIVEEFENAYASYTGTEFAVAVNSGTAALHLALLAHGIGEGDEVITTPFTFIATANAILFTGARPVFADIEQDTFNIDPNKIKEKITKQTRAILPVHLFGQPCDMERIMEIARKNHLAVIEDACQAHGAEYKGNKAGSFGTGCFSFYPTKNMTTGEGGMVTTNDPDIAKKVRILRNHGQQERYNHIMIGFNYRMTNIGAAIGLCQLRMLDQFNLQRISNAKLFTEQLGQEPGIIAPYISPDVVHVFHQYTIRITENNRMSRQSLREKLAAKGIGTEIYYPVPVHQQPYYQRLRYDDRCPAAEKAGAEVLSLPVHPGLSEKEVDYIVSVIKSD